MKLQSHFAYIVLLICMALLSVPSQQVSALEVPQPTGATELSVTGIPEDAPISIEASATATNVNFELTLEPEWHVYSRDVGGGQPVSVTLSSLSGVIAKGELELPSTPSGKLSGSVPISLPIGLGPSGASRRLEGSLKLQVCDALMCLPPMEVHFGGEIPKLRVLLVVGEHDDRTTRIDDWLAGRGFETSVKTYADVEASDCDACDVVLADSNVFGKTSASRADVRRFPQSQTPLVAVGFNGTELIESHEIAMTSGYI